MTTRVPALALLAGLAACDAMPVDLPASSSMSPELVERIEAELAAFSGVPVDGYADDYPIHLYWITGPPQWEPLRIAVEAAARKWAHIIAPTPTAPYTFQDDAECGHPGYGWLGFEAGSAISPGLHLYVHAGPQRPTWVRRDEHDWGRVVREYHGWAAECVPRSWTKTEDNFYRPANSQYNPVGNTTPAGIIGLPEEIWGPMASSFHQLTPRHAYATALHLIGHVLGVGTGAKWWDNMEIVRGFGYLRISQDSTWWIESDRPAIFFTDSAAVEGLARVLESQGRPYDQKMVPLLGGGAKVSSTATTSDTTYYPPVHWHYCLTDGLSVYDRTAGGWWDVTGELMGQDGASMIDPRITAPTLAALQGFTVRPYSAEYMVYRSSSRRYCPMPKPDSI